MKPETTTLEKRFVPQLVPLESRRHCFLSSLGKPKSQNLDYYPLGPNQFMNMVKI